ncbi:DUF4397 domain-containing protein [Nocardioides anomalus]|uniref:DUF4397 domain-containing protein n=1 Tax=Nocardioides anomalus TaxID=2712223 RepID=A0A6G6WDT0_9ACTN|nr:DUF4397 domain-containing protein [Nocardioides anomalus]QIG43369.1 DUF4397 domain-containing protein [Nocardioides anomalus]
MSALRRVVVSLLVPIALLASAPGTARAEEITTAVPPGQSWVRVGHFVPGMGATSIEFQSLDDAGAAPVTLAADATYGDVSAYEKLTPGRYTATVYDSGAAEGSAPLLSRSLDVAANDARTVAVVGAAAAPRLVVLTDDLTPPQSGTARIRLLSAASAADAVTVTAVGGPTIAEDAVLGQATGYATVPAGSWTLQLKAATAEARQQNVPVVSGSIYTVVVLDAGDEKVRLDLVTDAAGAVVAPVGGAKTGLGGTASAVATTATPSPLLWVTVVALILGVALFGLWGRLRRQRRSTWNR